MSGRIPADSFSAAFLRSKGLTWREVGILLAQHEKRKVPYGADAAAKAAKRYLETCSK